MNAGISHHDTIRIKSKDNLYVSRELKAKVAADYIKTYEIDVQVEEGYQVERQLSTGKTELYDIFEVIFTEKGVIKPAMFEFKVGKTTAIKRPLFSQTIYVLNVLEQNAKNSGYLKIYIEFMKEATQHLALIYPFVPGLTALIEESNS